MTQWHDWPSVRKVSNPMRAAGRSTGQATLQHTLFRSVHRAHGELRGNRVGSASEPVLPTQCHDESNNRLPQEYSVRRRLCPVKKDDLRQPLAAGLEEFHCPGVRLVLGNISDGSGGDGIVPLSMTGETPVDVPGRSVSRCTSCPQDDMIILRRVEISMRHRRIRYRLSDVVLQAKTSLPCKPFQARYKDRRIPPSSPHVS